jgi:hypothetical protein
MSSCICGDGFVAPTLKTVDLVVYRPAGGAGTKAGASGWAVNKSPQAPEAGSGGIQIIYRKPFPECSDEVKHEY